METNYHSLVANNPQNILQFIKDEYPKLNPSETSSVSRFFAQIKKKVKTFDESLGFDIKDMVKLYCKIDKIFFKITERGFSLKEPIPREKKEVLVLVQKTLNKVIDKAAEAPRKSLLDLAKTLDLKNPGRKRQFFKKTLRENAEILEITSAVFTTLYKLRKDEKTVGFLYPIPHVISVVGQTFNFKILNKIKKSSIFAIEFDITNNKKEAKLKKQIDRLDKQIEKEVDLTAFKEANELIIQKRTKCNGKTSLPLINFPFSTEKTLSKFAEGFGIKTQSLESCKTQSKGISNLKLYGIKNPPKLEVSGFTSGEEDVFVTYDAWLRGDTKFSYSDQAQEAFHNSQRNIQMSRSIDKYIQEGQMPFASIGLGHFSGEKGLLSQLEKKGYTIIQINDREDYEETTEWLKENKEVY